MIAEVFRNEWPKIVASLVKDFGDLELAEDATQDAFLSASDAWASDGVPNKPGAWLLTAARRKAIDTMRRSGRYADKLQTLEAQARSATTTRTPDGLIDDQLALLLGCCHPALNRDAQVALTLRAVAGLSTHQIAAAYLVPEPTMGKRLSRARNKIRDAGIPFAVPDRALLRERLNEVLAVVYLIYTEGHTSSTDSELVRGDLCDEAIWLSALVAEIVAEDSETQALAALIHLSDARRAARSDDNGEPILLEDQDRSLWDMLKVDKGLGYLSAAKELSELGPFYFQAAVAAVHSTARSFDETEWHAIVGLYDAQLNLGSSPVLRLNRAAALSYLDGPAAALAEMDELAQDLSGYLYFHAARGEMLKRLGRSREANEAFDQALLCDPPEAQRKFLQAQKQP